MSTRQPMRKTWSKFLVHLYAHTAGTATVNLDVDYDVVISAPTDGSTIPNFPYELLRFTSSTDNQILISFLDFNFDPSLDFMTLYNGRTSDMSARTEIAQLSGGALPTDITSYRPHLWLELDSDTSSTGQGFVVKIRAVDEQGRYWIRSTFKVMKCIKNSNQLFWMLTIYQIWRFNQNLPSAVAQNYIPFLRIKKNIIGKGSCARLILAYYLILFHLFYTNSELYLRPLLFSSGRQDDLWGHLLQEGFHATHVSWRHWLWARATKCIRFSRT